jgi:hypothetical protein
MKMNSEKLDLIQVQKQSQNPCDFDQCPFIGDFEKNGYFFCFIHKGEYQNILQGRQPDNFNDK